MDKSQIEAIENAMREEHSRDLDALMRLKRFLPNGSNGAPGAALRADTPDPRDGDGQATPTLRAAVGQAMANDPNQTWTSQKMFAHLEKSKFPFQAKKPINSIIVAMAYWTTKRQLATVVKRGHGRAPNVVRWKPGIPFPTDQNEDSLSMGGHK